jgi:hypothetical protein
MSFEAWQCLLRGQSGIARQLIAGEGSHRRIPMAPAGTASPSSRTRPVRPPRAPDLTRLSPAPRERGLSGRGVYANHFLPIPVLSAEKASRNNR